MDIPESLVSALLEVAEAHRQSAAAMRDLADSNRVMVDMLAEQMADQVEEDCAGADEIGLDGTPLGG